MVRDPETTEESIAQSIIPYNKDDNRARFLGLRCSGFTIREALQWLGISKAALSMWRERNPEFPKLEERIPELRKTLGMEYAALEFLRNYRLILQKDFQAITGSINREKDKDGNTIPQNHQDFQYLLRARAHYTPQQLQALEQIFVTGASGEQFDFMDYVLRRRTVTEEIAVGTHQRREAPLAVVGND